MVIFSKLNRKEIVDILSNYKIGRYKSHSYMKGVYDNHMYILNTSTGKYIIKINKKINKNSYLNQLEYIDFLYSKKIPVAKNIKNKKGNELIPYRKKYYIIQRYIEGKSAQDMGIPLSIEMGKQIGKLHSTLVKSKYSKGNKSHSYKKRSFKSIKDGEKIQGIYNELLKNLNGLNFSKLRSSYIHSDLSEGNMLVKNKKLISIIDFDDSDYDYIAYDTAIFIAHFYLSRKRIQRMKAKIFLKEYSKYFALNNEERKAIYYLAKYRLFGILSWYIEHLKSHPKETPSMKKGIKRNSEVVMRLDKFTLEDFMKFIPK